MTDLAQTHDQFAAAIARTGDPIRLTLPKPLHDYTPAQRDAIAAWLEGVVSDVRYGTRWRDWLVEEFFVT